MAQTPDTHQAAGSKTDHCHGLKIGVNALLPTLKSGINISSQQSQ